jgi:predicted MFS family arabinose efflux permease
VGRLAELIAPSRLGVGFRWLLPSSWLTNLGDGFALAAGPLLVASLTDDAFLVALAATFQWLPPLLFAPIAGALTDRHNRLRIIQLVNLARVGMLAVLVLAIATGYGSIGVVLTALFVLSTAEVFADSSTSTLLPMLVARDDLAIANSRLLTGMITFNQLAGPPLGAALFVIGSAWPFGAEALLIGMSVVLVSRIVLPAHVDADRSERHLHHDIIEGFRWVIHHPAVRTLVLTIFIFNITFGAAWSVLVLYASQRLGLGDIGFGLLTTVMATGGLLGTASYGWITRRVSLGDIMRAGLIVETLTHLVLALTTSAWVAVPVFLIFGAHAFIWGTTSVTIRQRVVPTKLQGRVGSVNMVGTYGGLVIGSGIGGVLAQHYGITAPFWFAFIGSALFVVVIWRQLSHISHEDQRPSS